MKPSASITLTSSTSPPTPPISNLFDIMKFAGIVAAVSALLPAALACNGHTGGVPKAVGTKTNSKVIEVPAGEVFDGEWYRYDRGSGACSNQAEGGCPLQGTLQPRGERHGPQSDVPSQLTRTQFVWWEDVCEDALSIKDDGAGKESWVIGGGAYHASDKVIQHNGCGTVNIINFYVEDYGKLYRSCGNVSSDFEALCQAATDEHHSARSSASATCTLRASRRRTVVSLLVSTATTRTRPRSRTCALMRRPSARCTLAARAAASPRRPVPAPVKLASFGPERRASADPFDAGVVTVAGAVWYGLERRVEVLLYILILHRTCTYFMDPAIHPELRAV
ncbi:hypothetical protein J1614_003336 [Plenodomus biglobosus]|nr:hypothetical protein J1614_003336 [Plenodomus biglobosus]